MPNKEVFGSVTKAGVWRVSQNATLLKPKRIHADKTANVCGTDRNIRCMMFLTRRMACLGVCLLGFAVQLAAEPLPSRLQGTWRITRMLPTTNRSCWDHAQAQQLIGSTLRYRGDVLRWRGGEVPLQEVVTRTVTAEQFRQETGGSDEGKGSASFGQLGIRANAVTEVDLQHEDADVTGATTEVPGDSVLLAGPNRIIVSACGVYFEATRAASAVREASFRP